MIKWTAKNRKAHTSSSDVSIQAKVGFIRIVFRNHCKNLFGNEKQIAVGIDGNRMYFKVGDDTIDRFTLSDYSSNNLAVTLEGEERVEAYKKFDGDYSMNATDEDGLFYIEKETENASN